MVRPADPLDGATPSGASSIAEALQLAAHLVPADRAERYAAAADATLAGATPHPGPAAALGRALAGRRRSRGARTDPDRGGLRPAAVGTAGRGPPNWRPAERSSSAAPVNSSELLIDRDRVDGADAAYVCRGPGVRPAGHHRRGSRRRAGGVPCSVAAMPSPEDNTEDRQPLPRTRSPRASADDIAALYAEDATVEDPVGGEVHIGRQAIRGFYYERPEHGEQRDRAV